MPVLLHDAQEGNVILPEVPVEVIKALVQLIYKGECSLSPVADVVAIVNLARDLGFFIHPATLQVDEQEVHASDISAVDNRIAVNKVFPVNIERNLDGDDNIVPKEVVDEILQLSRAHSDSEVKDINRNIIKKKIKSDFPKLFCEHCEFSCKHRKGLKAHLDEVHKKNKFSCEHCEFKCKFWVGLKAHSEKDHKDNKFSCKKCHFEACSLINIKKHDKKVHVGKGNLVCEKCGFRAISVSKMAWHKDRVHKKVIFPVEADKNVESSIKKTIIKDKIKKTLRAKKPVSVDLLHCHVCDFKTFHKKSLEKHIVRFHKYM